MNNRTLNSWGWLPLWALMICAALLARPAMPVDETRYLSVAWEMWNSGQFLVPHSNGLPYSHKPPLLFWLIDFGWWLFGVQEWTARLTAPLCGLVTLFLSRRLAGSLFPQTPEVQRATPFILLAMLSWIFLASLTMFDTLMSCAALTAQLFAYRGATGKSSRWWLFLGLAIGVGVLAKGPIILVYALPVLLLAPWWAEQLPVTKRRWYAQSLLALVIGSITALSWALPAAWAGGEEYGSALLFGQTAGRMVESFDHQRAFYWYLLILPAVLFPWSCWIPLWRNLFQREKRNCGNRFLLSILLPGLVILSLISGKQVHYLLPLLPAAAILLARGAVSLQGGKKIDRMVFLSIGGSLTAVIAILPFLPIHGSSARFFQALPFWLGLCPLIASLPLIDYGQKQLRISAARMSLATTLLFVSVHIALSAPLNTNYGVSAISRALADINQHHQKIAVYPRKLDDQFHFAARLTDPVIPLASLEELSTVAATETDEALLLYLKQPTFPDPPAGTVTEKYKGGWLLLLQPGTYPQGSAFFKDLLTMFTTGR